MEIRTKFNFGDRVYFMHQNLICSGEIVGIKSTTFEVTPTKEHPAKSVTRVRYQFMHVGIMHEELDTDCFATSADLLDALLVKYNQSVANEKELAERMAKLKELEEIKKL